MVISLFAIYNQSEHAVKDDEKGTKTRLLMKHDTLRMID